MKEDVFRFKRFSLSNRLSPMKVGTDGVLLGAAATIRPGCRSILDIGTGTGVIALMLAQRTEDTSPSIKGIDIDEGAAAEANENFLSSPWRERLSIENISLSKEEGSFDLVVSNPPYFDSSLENPDPRRRDSRHTSSLSPSDVIGFSAQHLNDGGTLSMVLPSDCERRVLRIAASFSLYVFRILRIRTTSAKTPARIILEFSKSKADTAEEVLTISDQGRYTPQYTDLVKDFYLWA